MGNAGQVVQVEPTRLPNRLDAGVKAKTGLGGSRAASRVCRARRVQLGGPGDSVVSGNTSGSHMLS